MADKEGRNESKLLSLVDGLISEDELLFRKEHLTRNLAIGFVAGTIIGIGGGVKDAPYEGFRIKTFIRSPIIGALSCAVLGILIPNAHWFLLFLGTVGVERITIEIYKLLRSKQPGKFENGEWGTPKPQLEPEIVVPKPPVPLPDLSTRIPLN